jgi:hypothetical protein
MNNLLLIDPLGNEVILPETLCDFTKLEVDACEVYDKPSRVIEAPAIMLEVMQGPAENYYYRSLGWESNLLIVTKKIEGKWTAHKVMKNPSGKQLSDIYKKSREVSLIQCNKPNFALYQ